MFSTISLPKDFLHLSELKSSYSNLSLKQPDLHKDEQQTEHKL